MSDLPVLLSTLELFPIVFSPTPQLKESERTVWCLAAHWCETTTGVIYKLAEGIHDPNIHVTGEDTSSIGSGIGS